MKSGSGEVETKSDTQPEAEAIIHAASQARTMSRRHLIAMGAGLVAGFVSLLWPKFTPECEGNKEKFAGGCHYRNPRRLTQKTPALFCVVNREEGFYVRQPGGAPGSRRDSNAEQAKSVIHYVDAKRRIPFIARINEDKLRPATPEETAFSSPSTRVHFARASASFELAALAQISKQQYTPACQFLVEGIKHDLDFKRPRFGAPSLRLFDLLALVAVRQEQPQYLTMLSNLAKEAGMLVERQEVSLPARRKRRRAAATTQTPEATVDFERRQLELDQASQRRKDAFAARVAKWQDPNWQQRVKDPARKVIWKATLAPDTTEGKREPPQQFEIASVAPRANAGTPS